MTINYKYKANPKAGNFNFYFYEKIKDLEPWLSKDFLSQLKSNKENIVLHSNFEVTNVYIKLDVQGEKNRRLGAKLFSETKGLKPSKIVVLGNQNIEVIEGFVLRSYVFDRFKTKAKSQQLSLVLNLESKQKVERLEKLVYSVFWARDLVNQPYNILGTAEMEKQISSRFYGTAINVNFLNKKELVKQKFGGLLAVNKASEAEPRFGVFEYKPKNASNKKPIVLVGKGIVYDTGGLSLKPTAHSMDMMKCDMGGLATVVSTIDALANWKSDKWVICLTPITDNLIGNNAIAPGDVITMRSGTTVEIMNTDAEGRLVLADALDYAKSLNPELVIDAATLTGAAVGAFGYYAAAIMGNASSKTFHNIIGLGEKLGERLARMPFWEDYKQELDSSVADITNLGGKTAGAITAGKFLEHFVGYDWLHLDIAGPGYLHQPVHYNTIGGTGYGVRLLTNFINNY